MLDTQSLMIYVKHDAKDLKNGLGKSEAQYNQSDISYQQRGIVELTSESVNASDHKEPKVLGAEL